MAYTTFEFQKSVPSMSKVFQGSVKIREGEVGQSKSVCLSWKMARCDGGLRGHIIALGDSGEREWEAETHTWREQAYTGHFSMLIQHLESRFNTLKWIWSQNIL